MNILNSFKYLVVASLLLVIAACAKTSTVKTADVGAGSINMQVFYSPPTDKPYEELGLVTTQSGQTVFHDRSAEGMVEKLKQEAMKLNADAIIVQSAKEGSWGLKGGGTTGFDRGNASAIAIKFK